MKENETQIVETGYTYICPKHGKVEGTLEITNEHKATHYCFTCYAEFIDKNITKVEVLKPV